MFTVSQKVWKLSFQTFLNNDSLNRCDYIFLAKINQKNLTN